MMDIDRHDEVDWQALYEAVGPALDRLRNERDNWVKKFDEAHALARSLEVERDEIAYDLARERRETEALELELERAEADRDLAREEARHQAHEVDAARADRDKLRAALRETIERHRLLMRDFSASRVNASEGAAGWYAALLAFPDIWERHGINPATLEKGQRQLQDIEIILDDGPGEG